MPIAEGWCPGLIHNDLCSSWRSACGTARFSCDAFLSSRMCHESAGIHLALSHISEIGHGPDLTDPKTALTYIIFGSLHACLHKSEERPP